MSGATRQASKDRSRARAKDQAGNLTAALDDLINSATDLTSAWPVIGQVWAEREMQIFATESNGRWAPLRTATILRKRREGIVADALVETGALRRALTNAIPRSQGPGFAVYGPAKGVQIEYAKYHVRGNFLVNVELSRGETQS